MSTAHDGTPGNGSTPRPGAPYEENLRQTAPAQNRDHDQDSAAGLDPTSVVSAAKMADELGLDYFAFLRLVKSGKVPAHVVRVGDAIRYECRRADVWSAPAVEKLLTTDLTRQAETVAKRRAIAWALFCHRRQEAGRIAAENGQTWRKLPPMSTWTNDSDPGDAR